MISGEGMASGSVEEDSSLSRTKHLSFKLGQQDQLTLFLIK